jgi:hypothetical protein
MFPNSKASTTSQVQDWRLLAEQASKELDPKKLSQLVHARCDRLLEAEQVKKEISPRDASPASGYPKPSKPNDP